MCIRDRDQRINWCGKEEINKKFARSSTCQISRTEIKNQLKLEIKLETWKTETLAKAETESGTAKSDQHQNKENKPQRWEGGERLREKKKKKGCQVTHPSTNRARRCLTSVIGREPVLSTWYGRWQETVMKCCLMSSDVSWHIRDKLRPMPKHGSIILYVHGNQKAR